MVAGAGAAGEYARGVVGGQQRGGPTTSRLGIGRRMLVPPTIGGEPAATVVVDVADVDNGDAASGGGGARSLSNAALHCSRAPGMCNRCVASSTL
ncbi:hypothetical protein RF55_8228 [Lasius niger]|uniref:Uncharacterized protein n=1 Tax=Lasius niger TaxID=67767 RepID=A0A0J7KNP4_LASNI|nr:hypothetical protein RF55_8228 [Lasius niger]